MVRGRVAAAWAGVAALFGLTVALPLATYTTALALFGLAHVGSELRYLDQRFGLRLRTGLYWPLGLLLAAALAARAAGMQGWLGRGEAAALEVGLGGALVALMLAQAGSAAGRGTAAGLALALLLGASLAPMATLLVFAVTHNLTPLALLAERFAGPEQQRARRQALGLGGSALLGLPLLIATGWPFHALAAIGLVAPEAGPFPGAGDLTANFGAYVPSWAWDSEWALHAFTAAVFAQCMHYVAVIGVLPRLLAPGAAARLPWRSAGWFWAGLAVAAGGLALGFALDYGAARRLYALAALVHAWLELPVLVLVVEAFQRPASRPTPREAAFASSASASARPQGSGTSRA